MSGFFEQVDRTPVSYVVLLAYITLAFLTDPVAPSTEMLIEHGGAAGILIQDGQWWRLLTCAFLHGGFVHLLFNGYCLYMVGPMVETSLGSLRFVLLYVVAALAGSVAAMTFTHPLIPMIGGSGALFGMFGAMVAANMRSGRGLWDFLQYRGPRSIVMLIVLNLVLGFIIPGISNSAHIGGLIGGFVLVFVFLDRGRHDEPDGVTRVVQSGWIALLAAWTFYVAHPVASEALLRIRLEANSLTREEWHSEIHKYYADERAEALKRLRRDR